MGIDWTHEDLLLLRSKVHELNVTFNRLATWWNQRAKARWHEDGDINSKVFHNFATARRNGNRVVQIKDVHNNTQEEDDEIEKVFIQFFEAKWQSSTCELTATVLVNRLKKCISKLITEEEMAFMPGRSISKHCLLAQEIFHKFKMSKNKKGLMALKLDMDRLMIAWDGLHLIKSLNGVRFSIIINGRNSEWIDAHSGFRQGCPLSPYLFIMCFQLVSNSIEQKGQDLGIRVSPRGPRITHLLYADDVLIFSYVSIWLAKALKKIVEDFCKWTGQRINVSKFQIFFGKVVGYSTKKKITRLFGYKNVKEMSYLGIKLSLNRLKLADFQDLLSNVMDRLNAWGKKTLSLGGKITLISSSLLSMPNFLVTHSLLPKKLLYEVEKLCRNFLWHKPGGEHSMHYVAWEDLCKPRSMGGMRLQSPLMRVGSSRSKLAWDFFQKTESLCYKTIKHKYGDDLMIGSQKKVTSNTFKILLDGGRQLQNITKWAVGSGNKINVLNDIWVLDKCNSKWPTLVDCVVLEGMNVRQLLLSEGQWNYTLLHEVFHPEFIMLINNIQINPGMEDRRELLRMHSGKSISAMSYEYMLNSNCNMDGEDYYTWLLAVELACARGCNTNESYEHIMKLRRLSTRNLGIFKIYCTIVYLSWRNKNCVKHGKYALPSSVIASNALALYSNKDSLYLSNWGTNLLRESCESWCPPLKDWMKINVDASLLRSNCAGVGGIFRDHKGMSIFAFGEKKVHWDITKLEMEAVFSVREYIRSWKLEYKGVIIESDNLNVIKFIQDSFKKNKGTVDMWPLEELLFFNDFHKVVFNHVHRSCNKVANLCATMALSRSFFFDSFSFGYIPSLLLYSIKEECDYFHSYQV
ncbi:uncharacterized protein LOC110114460 [Dendrobium catenatum]|uniref:uncharacterized protein LOC110114460 n=1 Tax=Dendrobium catenatum TaxID=906689 RepID=UPI0009F20392|nr:uncharacterized protein LOC110114460 [Dendrobium catenatum]